MCPKCGHYTTTYYDNHTKPYRYILRCDVCHYIWGKKDQEVEDNTQQDDEI